MKKLSTSKITLLILLVVFSGGWISQVRAQCDGTLMEPMDVAKKATASCAIDSKIYVFGGNAVTNSLNSAIVYDVMTNTWSDLAPIPINLNHTTAEVVNNKIYVTGGLTKSSSTDMVKSTFEYDPSEDSWTSREDLPKAKGSPSSCVINDSIYIIGGWKDWPIYDTSSQREVKVYDPSTDTWDSIPNMIYQHGYASSCVMNDTIYVFGGLRGGLPNSGYFTNKAEMYDPKMKVWTELPDIPVNLAYHISVIHKNKILLFGGETGTDMNVDNHTVSSILEYDPYTETWGSFRDMPFPLSDMTAQKVGDYLYLIGGNAEGVFKSEVRKVNLDCIVYTAPILISPNQVRIYPNPVKDLITIETNYSDHHSIEIISLTGQLLFNTEMEGNPMHIDLSNFSKGIYFITIRSKELTWTEKMLKF